MMDDAITAILHDCTRTFGAPMFACECRERAAVSPEFQYIIHRVFAIESAPGKSIPYEERRYEIEWWGIPGDPPDAEKRATKMSPGSYFLFRRG
jgi:hypothetical protein